MIVSLICPRRSRGESAPPPLPPRRLTRRQPPGRPRRGTAPASKKPLAGLRHATGYRVTFWPLGASRCRRIAAPPPVPDCPRRSCAPVVATRANPARLRSAFRTPPALPRRVLPAAERLRALLDAGALRRLLRRVALGPAPAAALRRPAKGRSPACAAPGATVSPPARGLAARDRYAGQSQRQATGNAPRLRIKSEIRKPAAPEAARSPWPMFARCARLHAGRSGVNAPLRYAFNITAHYPKSGQSLRRLRFVARPLRALRVRVMVCYVLRPCSAKGVSRRCAVVYLARFARGWHTPNLWAALPRLRRARWPASPVVSWQTTVPPAPTFRVFRRKGIFELFRPLCGRLNHQRPVHWRPVNTFIYSGHFSASPTAFDARRPPARCRACGPVRFPAPGRKPTRRNTSGKPPPIRLALG